MSFPCRQCVEIFGSHQSHPFEFGYLNYTCCRLQIIKLLNEKFSPDLSYFLFILGTFAKLQKQDC